MAKRKICVLTGAGISAESGLGTFRGAGGLWEGVDVQKVVTLEGWRDDPQLVLDFYNQRRRAVRRAKPNAAHLALVELEQAFDVTIVTQNVDDLHERAGSSSVLHLHGEIGKARSTINDSLVYDLKGRDIRLGDCCELGSQLRPHIVWFGEAVPAMTTAMEIAGSADLFMVIGTSLLVYPAAGLIEFVKSYVVKYVVDLEVPVSVRVFSNVEVIEAKAGVGVPTLVKKLLLEAEELDEAV